jgi:hypothetical protein
MPDEVVHSLGSMPPVPAGPIASAIKRVTFQALNDLPPGANGAIVKVSHTKGVELAFAHRGAEGRWSVSAWVGKNWAQSSPLEFGATAQVLW